MAEFLDKVTVIMGAGASKDAWNETGAPCDPEWTPPLAAELFGHRKAFWSVLNRYQGARVLATDLGERARAGNLNLEASLRTYAEHKDTRVRFHYRHVPPYLRDLLNEVAKNYIPGGYPGTHVRLMMGLLPAGVQVGFVVLNYDNYVERALSEFDPGLQIARMEDYVATERQALIFKVHGSVDWGIPMGPRNSGESWDTALNRYQPLATAPKSAVLAPSSKETRQWMFRRHDGFEAWLYPCLTAPLAGKGELDLVCPSQHLHVLHSHLAGSRHFLIIGTSGLDDDLLALLARWVQAVDVVHYVSNSAKTANVVQRRFRKTAIPFRRAKETVLFGRGFRQYVGSPEFDQLLQRWNR